MNPLGDTCGVEPPDASPVPLVTILPLSFLRTTSVKEGDDVMSRSGDGPSEEDGVKSSHSDGSSMERLARVWEGEKGEVAELSEEEAPTFGLEGGRRSPRWHQRGHCQDVAPGT
jgi:hypothetical protein